MARLSLTVEERQALLHLQEVAGAAVFCGAAGVLGSALMLLGDGLLYGPAAWGEPGEVYFAEVDPAARPERLATSLMGRATPSRVIAGGALGPVAAVPYLVGCVQMLLPSLRALAAAPLRQVRWGLLASGGHGAAMVAVAAYHSAFAYTAFLAAEPAPLALVHAHATYMATLRLLITACGLLGTAGLAATCWRDRWLYPRWLLGLTPSLWLLLLRPYLRLLPAPFGLLLAGGSFNLTFGAFFTATTIQALRVRRDLHIALRQEHPLASHNLCYAVDAIKKKDE